VFYSSTFFVRDKHAWTVEFPVTIGRLYFWWPSCLLCNGNGDPIFSGG